MVECDYCDLETYMPFRCNYCGKYYCSKHRLPELHNCTGAYQYSRSSTGYAEYRASAQPYKAKSKTRAGYRTRLWFGKRELRDLGIALILIMAIPLFLYMRAFFWNPAELLGVVLVFGLAFLLHEIAHKFAAQKLGYWAEFRINKTGLLFTLLSIFSPFKIIAPGAVMLGGVMNWEDYGKIAVVGPITNIAQSIVYLVINLMTSSRLFFIISLYGILVNSSLALFNLIPFGVFDGRKIMNWNRFVWGATFLAALLTYLYASMLAGSF